MEFTTVHLPPGGDPWYTTCPACEEILSVGRAIVLLMDNGRPVGLLADNIGCPRCSRVGRIAVMNIPRLYANYVAASIDVSIFNCAPEMIGFTPIEEFPWILDMLETASVVVGETKKPATT